MGNFLVGTLRFLPPPYARVGIPMLVAETRMGNVGQLFGDAIPEEALLDLDAAVTWLLEEGYDSLAPSDSSGATIAVRFAATRTLPHLRGVVLYGAPWGLPESAQVRCARWGSDPSYDAIAATVGDAIAADPDALHPDRLFTIAQSRGPSRLPKDSEVYTWRTRRHSRGPHAHPVMTWRRSRPSLGADAVDSGDRRRKWSFRMRRAVWSKSRGRRATTTFGLLSVDGGTHFFTGCETTVTQHVTRWLDRIA